MHHALDSPVTPSLHPLEDACDLLAPKFQAEAWFLDKRYEVEMMVQGYEGFGFTITHM